MSSSPLQEQTNTPPSEGRKSMRSRRASTRSKTVATRRSTRQDVHITHDVEPSDDEHEQKQQDKPQVRKRNLRQRRVISPSPAASMRSTRSSRSRSNSEDQEDNLGTGKGMRRSTRRSKATGKEVNELSGPTQSVSRRSQRCREAVVEERNDVEAQVDSNGNDMGNANACIHEDAEEKGEESDECDDDVPTWTGDTTHAVSPIKGSAVDHEEQKEHSQLNISQASVVSAHSLGDIGSPNGTLVDFGGALMSPSAIYGPDGELRSPLDLRELGSIVEAADIGNVVGQGSAEYDADHSFSAACIATAEHVLQQHGDVQHVATANVVTDDEIARLTPEELEAELQAQGPGLPNFADMSIGAGGDFNDYNGLFASKAKAHEAEIATQQQRRGRRTNKSKAKAKVGSGGGAARRTKKTGKAPGVQSTSSATAAQGAATDSFPEFGIDVTDSALEVPGVLPLDALNIPSTIPPKKRKPSKPKPPKEGGREFHSKDSISILKDWMFHPDNVSNPYPTNSQKDELMAETGLSKRQIDTWFVNARKRFWAPKYGPTPKAIAKSNATETKSGGTNSRRNGRAAARKAESTDGDGASEEVVVDVVTSVPPDASAKAPVTVATTAQPAEAATAKTEKAVGGADAADRTTTRVIMPSTPIAAVIATATTPASAAAVAQVVKEAEDIAVAAEAMPQSTTPPKRVACFKAGKTPAAATVQTKQIQTPAKGPSALVGRRVGLDGERWGRNSGSFHIGTVQSYDSKSRKYRVQFSDGWDEISAAHVKSNLIDCGEINSDQTDAETSSTMFVFGDRVESEAPRVVKPDGKNLSKDALFSPQFTFDAKEATAAEFAMASLANVPELVSPAQSGADDEGAQNEWVNCSACGKWRRLFGALSTGTQFYCGGLKAPSNSACAKPCSWIVSQVGCDVADTFAKDGIHCLDDIAGEKLELLQTLGWSYNHASKGIIKL